ncbi:GNAT family N-acetyltransferase [Streptomyces cavernicola]|uniref:GNAT family N-acetyltransferase n=1 Tax=Streptomyces cavernicola TaxID=3043613 RepID=A0ABT6SIC9_9ACTN|nr:GNAT family N-acetyltransferase [Streptomyces sp. B-S-A6]MDI3407006.1 GNAT family N-acetyltransferase [Streptomyces sp. B-S-A6]
MNESVVSVRQMTPDDCPAVAEIRVRGWQFAYAGLIPQSYLDAMDIAADTERCRERQARGDPAVVGLVAERAGTTVGWASFGPYRDSDLPPTDTELYALYVHPEHIGTGAGRALMRSVLAHCTALATPRVRLWVLRDNMRARRFYASAGFTPDGAEEVSELDGVRVPELRLTLPLPAPSRKSCRTGLLKRRRG